MNSFHKRLRSQRLTAHQAASWKRRQRWMTDVPCPWKVYNAAVGTALEIKIYAALWERDHERPAERGRGVFRRIWRSQAGRGGRHPEELGAALRRRVYPCSSGDPHASTLRKLSKRRSEGWTPFPREPCRASAQSARNASLSPPSWPFARAHRAQPGARGAAAALRPLSGCSSARPAGHRSRRQVWTWRPRGRRESCPAVAFTWFTREPDLGPRAPW